MNEQLAWAAGIFDGEGYFGNNRNVAPCPTVLVTQSSTTGPPEMLVRLQQLFGGTIRGPQIKGDRKPIYRWNVNGFERVQNIVAAVWPWLGDVKRAQSSAALLLFRQTWRPPGQRKRETHARRRAEA